VTAGTLLDSGCSFASPCESTRSGLPHLRRANYAQRCGVGAIGGLKPKGQASWNAVIGAAEVVSGVSLILWTTGMLHARAQKGQISRRVSTADQADQAPAKFDVAAQPGVCAPCGEPGVSYWDPAGLARNIDEATFRQYRKAELKHGRVCMLAVTGLLAQHSWRFNLLYPYRAEAGPYDFEGVPSGLAAVGENPASGFLGLFVLAAGLIELRSSDDGKEPGDFGDPLKFAANFDVDDPTQWRNFERTQWQNAELNNGRLAMIGFLGAAAAEYATDLDAVDQWVRAGAAYKRTVALFQFGIKGTLGIQGIQGPVPPLPEFF